MKEALKDLYIEIAKGIVHRYDEDMIYIAKQIDTYKDHPENTEIIRNLGMLYYDLLPEGNKHELKKVIAMDASNVGLLTYLAQYCIAKKEHAKAEDILNIVVAEIETWELQPEGEARFSFDNLLQLFLYAQNFDQEKEIKQAQLPLSEIYRTLANVLFLSQQYEKAQEALDKALRWNPVDVMTMFDKAEIYMQLDQLDAFYDISKEALLYSYQLTALARSYRNIGHYHLHEKEMETAIASYYMSLVFEKSEIALKALYQVYEITKEELQTPDLDEMKAVLETKHIQVGASTLVVDTILQIAKEYDEMNQRPVAIEYLTMAHQLTNDESLLAIIEEMKLPSKEES